MVSADTARTLVGILGNIISLCLFLSPTPTFYRIWKKGSVEQYSPAPYLATLANCMLWVVYGLPLVHPHSMLVITINGAGCIIELAFVLLYLFYSDGKKRLRIFIILLIEIAFVVAFAILVISIAHTYDRRSLVVGSVSVFFCVLMYAAPLSVMKMVITTKSVEYMPFSLSFLSLANAICWTSYALIRFDLFITIPNSLGTMLGIAQLILYATFYKSTKRQMEARKSKGGAALADIVVINGEPKKMGNGQRTSEINET